jgi:hypothetical protein
MKYIFALFVISFSLFSQTVQKLDFEAGGFVLSQIPNNDGSTVFARTDVGGVYKKVGGGDWQFIGQFAETPAALMVQSIFINPNNQRELIAAVGMDYLKDDLGRGLWKTDDEGVTWRHILGPNTGHPDVNFGGNVFRVKLGTPCARYHPTVPNRIICGGLGGASGIPNIYMSDDNGESWRVISSSSSINGNVVSIQIHPKFPDQIWVGTDKGLWITRDNGATWSSQIFPGEINGVAQMLLKDNGKGGLTAFVTTGRLYKLSNDATSIKDLSPAFGNYSGFGSSFVGLQFMDGTESKFVCMLMGSHAKVTTDEGETWSERVDFTLERKYNPKFSLNTEDKIYISNVIAFQDPKNYNVWYMSGGAGPFISTNKGKSWRYNGQGIDMVVVYDVSFSPNGDDYVSISDWGMAVTNDATLPKIKNYSRQSTLDPPPPEANGDSYIPNVCRTLVSKVNPNRIYLIGGSVFTHYPVITKSENRGEPGSYKIMSPQGLMCYPSTGPGEDALLSDGSVTTDGTNDYIILLMGGGHYEHKIYDPGNPGAYYYGVYFSSNGGQSFEKSVFEGYSGDIYNHSIVGGIFTPLDYMAVDPVDPARVYVYFEGGNDDGVQAGGLFISNDYGRTFTHKSYVINNPAIDYRNKGAIEIDPTGNGVLWAGIMNYGLFKSVDRGESFTQISGWKSISTLDSKGSNVAVFGMQDSDTFNRLYLSKDGGSTWENIYLSGYGVVPSTRKLDFHDYKDNELWISTGGQGLFIYKF